MSQEILIIGDSGSGKSTSYETLDPAETFIINVDNKPFPFTGWKAKYRPFTKETPKGNYLATDNSEKIINTLGYISRHRPEIKHVVLDDTQYIMTNEYMRRAGEKGYQKFTDIATQLWSVIKAGKEMRDDIDFIVIGHADTERDVDGKEKTKFKTVGKLVDNAIIVEGMFTVVLFAQTRVEPDKTVTRNFVTQTDGTTTAKSPREMFNDLRIPNDLSYVVKTARAYYGEEVAEAVTN